MFDGYKMVAGYLLMFIFTICMLGRFNRIELRLYLSMAGIFGVIMGYIISLGITSLCGFPLTPLAVLLPFVFLGELLVSEHAYALFG